MEGIDVIDFVEAVIEPGIRQEIRAVPQHGPPGIFLADAVIASSEDSEIASSRSIARYR